MVNITEHDEAAELLQKFSEVLTPCKRGQIPFAANKRELYLQLIITSADE